MAWQFGLSKAPRSFQCVARWRTTGSDSHDRLPGERGRFLDSTVVELSMYLVRALVDSVSYRRAEHQSRGCMVAPGWREPGLELGETWVGVEWGYLMF